MGDRANVWIRESKKDSGIYLYTHWGGSGLPETLQAALKQAKRDDRLNDTPYLTRIIFCHMISYGHSNPASALRESTGYGISNELGDGGARVLTVFPGDKVISQNVDSDITYKTWTIDEFINLKDPSWVYKDDEEEEDE